jgi:hypothetical protein
MQISADGPNGFDGRADGREKLAGLQLGHFGAFYKRSWRSNDWMWGRLDAVYGLIRILLNPWHLRQLATREPQLADRLHSEIYGIALAKEDREASEVLAPYWDESRIRDELAFLNDPDSALPPELPACIEALARRIQLAILQEEVPGVVDSVRRDLDSGAAQLSAAVQFVQAADSEASAAGPGQRISPAAAVRLFRRCFVGQERWSEEANSRLYVDTMNRATAIGLQAARAARSGPGSLRQSVASLRRFRPAYTPVLNGYVKKSSLLFTLTIVLLAAGGSLLAWGVAGRHLVWIAVAEGGIFMLAGLALAWVRARAKVRRVVLASGAGMAALLIALSLFVHGSPVGSGGVRVGLVTGLAVMAALMGGPARRRS